MYLSNTRTNSPLLFNIIQLKREIVILIIIIQFQFVEQELCRSFDYKPSSLFYVVYMQVVYDMEALYAHTQHEQEHLLNAFITTITPLYVPSPHTHTPQPFQNRCYYPTVEIRNFLFFASLFPRCLHLLFPAMQIIIIIAL